MAQWTIEKVKSELPDVKVKIDGKIYTGEVRGRLNDFATVTVFFLSPGTMFTYSWETITRALNNNKPLLV